MTPEHTRLTEANEGRADWRRFGPYLSERQWGTVREDYSPTGNAWAYIPHDAARSRAYRWGEEGIGGFSDDRQRLCFALALWNGRDPILKERLFGLSGPEGNHGEDVKELYYYLDGTPTHSYMKMLYKYPQQEFPYQRLVDENRNRTRKDPEFELLDTGIFDENRYFDVFPEYAKAGPDDLLIRITAHNRGTEEAELHLLPTLWFRNTWAWGYDDDQPRLTASEGGTILVRHRDLGDLTFYTENAPDLLFCDNETNRERLFGAASASRFPKDGINDFVVDGRPEAVNPDRSGTKAAAHYRFQVPAGQAVSVRLRLAAPGLARPFDDFDACFDLRIREADAFYATLQSDTLTEDARLVQRQAFAGMLWSKQFYYYDIPQWLDGDPAQPTPPPGRKTGRNSRWRHLNNADILSMPDKWEYPWYAAWDLAFHCLPLALLDAKFAKNQLLLLTKEWYMHPNGQLPAYEWEFGDVNPPVHAWAAWRVYKIDRKHNGRGDLRFLEEVYHKLLLNFTWWVNRKDTEGLNIFEGGFLGLDNIGVFDRSAPLPTGGYIEQADGTSWMAMYSLNLMRIALELGQYNPAYQSMATKFFEHFLYIAGAMANVGNQGINLWDEEDEFFYDVLHSPDHHRIRLKVRSMVGLIPLFAVEVLDEDLLANQPEFLERLNWFLENRPDLSNLVSRWQEPGKGARHLLSLLRGHRMKCLLRRMLDEAEFLSDYGVRALSRYHRDHPYVFRADGATFTVAYQPAESDSALFGGNSNWRGPIWFPVNYLLIESLQRFHHYYGDDFRVEYPTGSGQFATLSEIAQALTARLAGLFLRDADGRRAVFGENEKLQTDPHFRDYILFYEYFHGDNGRGIGAGHQTGWTGLIAKLLQPRNAATQAVPETRLDGVRQITRTVPKDL
ncbi:MGH1-like glycoside hydrolase domain-containing protein [Larkinella soli]|uniref:MGH1-like glycoside hydrolase domain-containing protein n=1 Tax=Larkinella soli TaxID=1770527 RepID=UPI001E62F8F4|nr:glucosidase [Larkinella soli]